MHLSVRFSVRTLILLVALSACALAAVIVPLERYKRFRLLERRGMSAIKAYQSHCPPHMTPHAWRETIYVVGNVWMNVLFYGPVDNDTIEAAVVRLEADVARADPSTAGDLLVRSLDQSVEIRPDRRRFIVAFQEQVRGFVAKAPQTGSVQGPTAARTLNGTAP